MRFFATQFSTIIAGLLIFGLVSEGQCLNKLKTNNLKKEESMPALRSEIPAQNRWNVEALYQTPELWQGDLIGIKGEKNGPKWPTLASYKGKLQDPSEMARFFDSYLTLQRKLEKLYVYAHLRLDEDLGNDAFKSNYGSISSLIHDFSLETSWVEPELLSLSSDNFQKLLHSEPLKPYRFYLEKVGRMRPHTLPKEQEELMALSGQALDASRKSFSALNNADMSFKSAIDSKGEEHLLTHGNYFSLMKSPDRALRKSAFENLHRSFEAHANTLCELLQGHVQAHLFSSRARNFKSCLEAALFPHQIEPSVYENLIAAIRQKLPLIHEYVALRKKVLKLSEIHMYDMATPLVEDAELHMEYPEAVQTVIASVAPLGEKYQKLLAQGLQNERWVDAFENQRKRSGAYSSGCYDSMPYILMNYHGTLNDVLTLAHEAGHSMHSLLSRKTQPYIYADYPIFVAEVASTFNEQLLLKHLKAKAESKKMQAFLINHQLEGIRNTIVRQTLFAEFELQIHKWVEEGVALTPTLLKDYYLKLNRDYYGPEIVLDPELAIEWSRIPHFYSNFYVYQYATGLSAALALFTQAMGDEKARDHYIAFLSSGGSKYPIDLLKGAGIDMCKPDAIIKAMDTFSTLMQELKNILH